ncbi:ECF transporter S component [Neobacillus mesonae]|uniref:ECF transporter S component n=1 Tax=Neobacillus mesonae TaxID=1193713 RepID=A0A3Q9QW14_9BACI|nr:ECF transporter S component [Neobacillus mesonae]AZU61809.1 ECF transporter S component [Neobacillus mesonae]
MKSKHNGKFISMCALFTALSVVGAAIKVPAVVASVALDAFPALLAAALLGGGAGALVGALGHLISALLGGFPLGPMHFLIAGEMAVLVWLFGVVYEKKHKLSAGGLFVLGNSFAAPFPFIFLVSKAFYIAMVPSLLIGSILNTVVALAAIPRLAAFVSHGFTKESVKR